MGEEFAPLRQLGDPADAAVCENGICVVPSAAAGQPGAPQEADE